MPASRRMPVAVLLCLLLAMPYRTRGEEKAVNYDEQVLRDAGLPTDGPGLLEFFRKRTLTDADRAKIGDLVRNLGSRSYDVRQKASADLLALGRVSRPYLKPALNDRDPEIVRRAERCLQAIERGAGTALPVAAARLLVLRKPPGAAAVILNYLPSADDEFLEDELQATLAAVAIQDGKPDPALIAALNDKAVARRAAAAAILGRLNDEALRRAVRGLLTDADPRVRLRAAEGLVRGKDKQAIPVLITLLDETPLMIAWSAEEWLYRIAGDKAPQVWVRAEGGAVRRKCRDAWTGWWREHEARIDLAKLDLDRQQLGLTLVCSWDGYNGGQGKVWEVGPDGKARWEINSVAHPVDAQMLSGNRVLIADQSTRKVTERDLQGKVLWEHVTNDSLVSCQRLPNGNTFIATYARVFELTPDGKEVYSHRGTQGAVYAAQKLRNGHVAYLGSNGMMVELDETGKEIKTLKLEPGPVGLVKFEILPGGRYLVGQREKVVELDGDGKVVWECAFANANCVFRLPNGNTLACSYPNRRVVEVDRGGKVVWEQRLDGGPLRAHRR